jgi:hypothetical protein
MTNVRQCHVKQIRKKSHDGKTRHPPSLVNSRDSAKEQRYDILRMLVRVGHLRIEVGGGVGVGVTLVKVGSAGERVGRGGRRGAQGGRA